jgi:hypothetical protein
MTKTRLWAIQLGAIAAVLLAASSCSKDKLKSIVIPNARPTVTITSAPIDPNQVCIPDPVRSCYSITVNWVGYDPDGRVDHYLFAIDPPTTANAETTWQVSRANEERLLFRSTTTVEDPGAAQPLARDFHEFVIKAVDNEGTPGPPVSRSFFSYTEAPSVLLTNPTPGDFSFPVLTSSVRFNWVGEDPDGVFNSKPVRYKFILLNPSSAKDGVSLHPDTVAIDPERLRRLFAPSFAGWDSVCATDPDGTVQSCDTTTFQYTNLPPNQTYLFAVVAFDEAGAYSPTFNLRSNMLRFRVRLASSAGPTITVFNEFFNYTWRPGYCICVQTEIFIEVPADRPVTFNWEATATEGADMRYFRWSLDNPDLADETPRSDERRDVTRWSTPSLNLTSITLDPFPGTVFPDPPEEHKLYVEAGDNVGLKSLAIIRFQVVRASWTTPERLGSILVVKDTRLQPDAADRTRPGCVNRPLAIWPTQAELDTFLFARGGVQTPQGWHAFPWRCYPAGSYSRPGLFAGYRVDTLGTRFQKRDLTVRLSRLSLYEHVVWITDGVSATYQNQGDNPSDPMTSLRYMSSAGRFNTFAAYIKQGGKAWLMGGGGAFASSFPFNSTSNDQPTITFSSLTQIRDLGSGRFMFDIARWQSEFRVAVSPGAILKYLGRYRDANDSDPTHYTHFRNEMPEEMLFRQRPVDSLPPNRTSNYYITVTPLEFLQIENRILENTSTNPEIPNETSTLDTLYKARGAGLPFEQGTDNDINPQRSVVMTYYHGPNVPQGFVFSGFNVWDFKRANGQGMVDFVLRRIWKQNRTSALRSPGVQAANRPAPRPSATLASPPDRTIRRSLRVRSAPSSSTARD